MKFAIELSGKCSSRLGTLIQPESGHKFTTPLLIQTTKGGSIPYLSREVFKYVTDRHQEESSNIIQICLETSERMEEAVREYGRGISSFVGYGDFLSFVTFRDFCDTAQSGFHEKNAMPLFTRKGKVAITPERYMNIIEVFKPSIYHTLCDADTDKESSKKRISKSVERTESFFQKCIMRHKSSQVLKNSAIFAPVVGGYCIESRKRALDTVKSIPEVSGFMIDGLHKGGQTATDLTITSVEKIVELCVQELPIDKPKAMLGPFTPLTILHLISAGIDIFDTSYAYLATNRTEAFIFSSNSKDPPKSEMTINLSANIYKEDFTGLLETCSCYSCKNHTKAYVHHLINTEELLAPILLMIHNLHHYMKFFDNIRQSIRENSLEQLIELIESQMPKEMEAQNAKNIQNENAVPVGDVIQDKKSEEKMEESSNNVQKVFAM